MHSIYLLFFSWLFYCYRYEHHKFHKPFKKDYLEGVVNLESIKDTAKLKTEDIENYAEHQFDKEYEKTCGLGYTFGWVSAQCFGLLYFVLGDVQLAFAVLTITEYSIKWWIRRATIPTEIQKIKNKLTKFV